MCALRSYAQARGQRSSNMAASMMPAKKTYFFKDGVAYTEDKILVKKLFLFNVAPELLPKQLEAYFTKFGPVERLQLFGSPHSAGSKYKGEKHKTKTGYIYFTDPRNAAKALRKTVHYVGRRRVCIQPSDSWHQPDAYSPSLEELPNEPPAPIMILNDHCLEHIVRQLSLLDRIRFARTCVRFQNVYQQVSPSLDKHVNFDDFMEMTVWDLRDFFKLSGRFIKQLEGIVPQRHSKRIFEFLGSNCNNLQKLSITATKLTLRNMYKTFEQMTQLQNLRLRACELTNESLLALEHLPELKKLDLSNNSKLTGANMVRLPVSITSLTLTSCIGLQSKLLAKVCRALVQLKELHLKGIYTLGAGFKQLASAKCCNVLETITVSNGSGLWPFNLYEHIAKLPSIKNIIVYSNEGDRLRPELLAMLAEFKATELQRLEIRGQNCINPDMILHLSKLTALHTLILPNNDALDDRCIELLGALQQLEEINLKYCPKLTDNAVLRLILACPKLKLLHLDYCPQLTGKLLTDIIFKMRIQIRQKETTERTLPIKMNMYGCHMDEATLQNADVTAKDIIDLSFALPSSSELCFFDMAELLAFDDDVYFSDGELDRVDMFDVGFLSDEFDFDDYDDEIDDYAYEHGYDGYDSDNVEWFGMEDPWD